jgi:hypothetical protein
MTDMTRFCVFADCCYREGMPTTKLDFALDAAARGFRCFPSEGKRPLIRRWPDNASSKESVLTRWWTRWPDADIGIALDADTYVLDADSSDALVALATLDLPRTLRVQTARGVHVYFKVPHELRRLNPLPHGKVGLAVLEGKGRPGPVTWAGSVHPSGHVYTVVCDAPVAQMPGELVRAIGPKPAQSAAGEATRDELAEWHGRHVHALAGGWPGVVADSLLLDAKADLRAQRRALQSSLPHLPTGWANEFFKAGAYLGPHIASGGLGYDDTVKELTDLFHECNEQDGDPSHVLRSIERGIVAGARSVKL